LGTGDLRNSRIFLKDIKVTLLRYDMQIQKTYKTIQKKYPTLN
jgi:hypothetical protein